MFKNIEFENHRSSENFNFRKDMILEYREILTDHYISSDFKNSLSSEVLSWLFSKKIITQCIPSSLGGDGAGWLSLVESSRLLSSFYPSAGWLTSLGGRHIFLASRFDNLISKIFLNAKDIFVSTSSFYEGTVVKVKDGAILNGLWKFSSGIEFSTHIVISASIEGVHYYFNIEPSEISIVDSWSASGLSETGTKTIELNNLFVKDDRIHLRSHILNNENRKKHPNILPFMSAVIIGPVMGCTDGIFSEYFKQVRKIMNSLPDSQLESIGRISAKYDACVLFYENITKKLDKFYREDLRFSDFDYSIVLRDNAYLTLECYEICHDIVMTLGMQSVFNTNLIQKYWRDIQVMSKHIDVDKHWNFQRFGSSYLAE